MIHGNLCQVLYIIVSNHGYPANGVPPLFKEIALQQVDFGSGSLNAHIKNARALGKCQSSVTPLIIRQSSKQ
jgi:hypothetical protein